jgi:hypothetical protein
MGLSDSFCNINQCITYDPHALFNDRSLMVWYCIPISGQLLYPAPDVTLPTGAAQEVLP